MRSSLVAAVVVLAAVMAGACGGSDGDDGDDDGERGKSVACTAPEDSLTDSDCQGTSRPVKLDCESAAEQDDAIGAGCIPEDAGDDTDYDVCCPSSVEPAG